MSFPLEVTHSSHPDRPLAHSSRTEGDGAPLLGTSQAALPISYPARFQNRSQVWAGCSGTHTGMPTGKMDAQSTPGLQRLFTLSVHSAGTAPQAAWGRDRSAPLPTPPPAPGGIPEASPPFEGGMPQKITLPSCRVGAWRCRAAHTRRGFGHKRSSPRGEAGQGASPVTGRGCRRAESAAGAQDSAGIPAHLPRPERSGERGSPHRGSHPRGLGPTGAHTPGLASPAATGPARPLLALLSPAAHRRGPGGEPAPGPAAAPTPPSRAPAWQEKERRDGNRRPYQQEGVRPASLLSLWEAKTFLLWQQPRSRTGYPHTDTARRTRPTPALSTWPPGGRRRAGRRALPRPGGRGRGARNRRRLPRREGSVGSSCGLIRPAGFMCQGNTARAANDVVLNHLHFK